MADKLKYEDLKLGEKAKQAFLEGKSADYIIKKCPVYLNTRSFFANLNVSDAAIASVLGGLNLLLVGNTGTGKTQLAKDIYNYYFAGNKKGQGHGILIRGRPELDIYSEIFTKLNINKAERELTKNIDALIYLADEINRNPPVAQNQFLGLGDGAMDYNGSAVKLGKKGYNLLIATANIGNGEFQGTFESDKALYNRLHIALDFDHEQFRPTKEDEMLIDILRSAHPEVKEAPKRDISNLVLKASQEIDEITKDPGLGALAVVNYLRFGLENCQEHRSKGKVWPLLCQDCTKNADEKTSTLCSLIRAPVRRTTNAVMRYAAALQYLAKLKNPEQELDSVDLMFKAFEAAGAYQFLLNPQVLRQEHYEQNPEMMAKAVELLKADFRQNEDYIMTSIEALKDNKKALSFFEQNKKIGIYDMLSAKAKANTEKIEPYTDDREIGLSWMKTFIDLNLKLRNRKKSS